MEVIDALPLILHGASEIPEPIHPSPWKRWSVPYRTGTEPDSVVFLNVRWTVNTSFLKTRRQKGTSGRGVRRSRFRLESRV